MSNQKELPKYLCQKRVWALKIAKIEKGTNETAIITPAEEGYGSFSVPIDYILSHAPREGGYYIQCKDGSISFCSAEEFEKNYVRA